MHLKCAKNQSSPEAIIDLTIKICSLKLKPLQQSKSSCTDQISWSCMSKPISWFTHAIASYTGLNLTTGLLQALSLLPFSLIIGNTINLLFPCSSTPRTAMLYGPRTDKRKGLELIDSFAENVSGSEITIHSSGDKYSM